MAENEFTLLKHLQKSKDKTSKEEIDKLRSLARQLLKTNNELTKEIWGINLQLSNETDPAERKSLLEKKTDFENQFYKKDYPTQIAELRKEIHRQEVELFGSSDVDNKPYKL